MTQVRQITLDAREQLLASDISLKLQDIGLSFPCHLDMVKTFLAIVSRLVSIEVNLDSLGASSLFYLIGAQEQLGPGGHLELIWKDGTKAADNWAKDFRANGMTSISLLSMVRVRYIITSHPHWRFLLLHFERKRREKKSGW